MKIDLAAAFAEEFGAKVGIAVRDLLTKELVLLEEQELLRELRESALSDIEKVRAYFLRTNNAVSDPDGGAVITVTNEYVHRNLDLTERRMKIARDLLEANGEIKTRFAAWGAIEIRHHRRG